MRIILMLLLVTAASCGPKVADEAPAEAEASPTELRLVISLPGDDFGEEGDLELRRKIEALIESERIGRVTRAGTGMGMMDIYLKVEDETEARAALKTLLAGTAPELPYSIEPVARVLP